MTPQLARLTDAPPPIVLRRRCCYCAIPHATDGLGPIRSGDLVSDGLCPIAYAKIHAELDRLEGIATDQGDGFRHA